MHVPTFDLPLPISRRQQPAVLAAGLIPAHRDDESLHASPVRDRDIVAIDLEPDRLVLIGQIDRLGALLRQRYRDRSPCCMALLLLLRPGLFGGAVIGGRDVSGCEAHGLFSVW